MNSLQLSLWKNPISEKAFDDCINCSTGTSESPNNTLVRIFFSKIQLLPKVQTSAHHSLLLPLYSVPIHIYRMEQQQRMATLARTGAICVDYDLYGWGESALQVGAEAHHTSDAHTIQAMNGLLILDDMLANRKDIDPARIGVNGGSGGGTQTVLLTVLDDRFTAAAPVVSLASHFDGGCPCESGKPIQLAGGGTCNAELAALFAPRPMLVVSDGGDWTATVPRLEYPYLQRIYGFYGATDKVSNVHLPQERHDFGPNKRNAVYDFFIDVFGLDRRMLDESKVTIESENALKSFGEKGEKLPAGALRYKE